MNFFLSDLDSTCCSAADALIQRAISRSGSQPVTTNAPQINLADNNPCAELDKFLNSPLLLRTECPDVIAWWGVSF